MTELVIRNRQRTRRVDTRFLSEVVRHLLEAELALPDHSFCVHLVGPAEMSRVNETYLGHAGSTDVITFNHAELDPELAEAAFSGEVFVCVADAVKLAARFNVPCQTEIVRYIVHGALHILGHDDLDPQKRRELKRHENRLVRRLSTRFDLTRVARQSGA